jgi:hypothetical protein
MPQYPQATKQPSLISLLMQCIKPTCMKMYGVLVSDVAMKKVMLFMYMVLYFLYVIRSWFCFFSLFFIPDVQFIHDCCCSRCIIQDFMKMLVWINFQRKIEELMSKQFGVCSVKGNLKCGPFYTETWLHEGNYKVTMLPNDNQRWILMLPLYFCR